MLRGISTLISPELLYTLARMGHGDELVFADAYFPGDSTNARVLRADGLLIRDLLDAILPLVVLDAYAATPLAMMAPAGGDRLDPAVEAGYRAVVECHYPGTPAPERLDRQAFYERARRAFAVVMTGDTALYGNLIVTKGNTLR